jgi:hypothetical protein
VQVQHEIKNLKATLEIVSQASVARLVGKVSWCQVGRLSGDSKLQSFHYLESGFFFWGG